MTGKPPKDKGKGIAIVKVKPRPNSTKKGKKPSYNSDNPRESTLQKEKLFVTRYLIDLSPTKAVLECGAWNFKSEQAASTFSNKLMKRPRVRLAIQAAMDKRAKKFEIVGDDVLNELAKLGFSNMDDYVRRTEDGDAILDLSEVTRDQMAAVQEITTEVYVDRSAPKELWDDGDGEDGDGPRKPSSPPVVKKTKLKLYDKKSPLEAIGKHLGLFNDPPPAPNRTNIRIKIVYEDKPKQLVEQAADFIDAG
jgi:phage terminase small subunit